MNTSGDMSAIWQIMLNNIRDDRTMPDTAIDLWFGRFTLTSLTTDKAVFAADSDMKREIIASKYTEFLTEHIYRVIGFKPSVDITVDTSLAGDPPVGDGIISPLRRMRELKAEHDAQLMEAEEAEEEEKEEDRPDFIFYGDEEDGDEELTEGELEEELIARHLADHPLKNDSHSDERRIHFNPDYTFENFIVGSSNKHAHASAEAVAKTPGRQYNPLFLYGNSGLGKTHLMYAIANKALENNPMMKVIYVKGEAFMNQLIESLRVRKNSDFRDKYRKADMLLIDDIQFISGKESTQQEFFHTFDALYEDHKQIIITSDKPPQEMVTLEERIRSRFEAGVIVDIQPPDFELRLAILQDKAMQNKLDIPMDVMTFLAEKLQSNIRQLEGVIKNLGAKHFLTGAPITMELVRTSVPEFIRESRSEEDLVRRIVDCVASRYKTTADEIYGRSRVKEIKNARNIAMRIIRDMTSLSMPKIGAYLNRDYSTVHSNLQAVDRMVETDSVLKAEIEGLIKEIKRM